MSTNFQHKYIIQHGFQSHKNKCKPKGVKEDVKTTNGPSVYSDHFLVKAVIKQKLSVILLYKKKWKPALKWNR